MKYLNRQLKMRTQASHQGTERVKVIRPLGKEPHAEAIERSNFGMAPVHQSEDYHILMIASTAKPEHAN